MRIVHAQQEHIRGQNVQPAYDGWDKNPDGSFNMYFGYLNRNYEEDPIVEVGPGNSFAPGEADRGQPTHFYARRQMFVFKVRVPADWGEKQELVWTVTHNGRTDKAVGWLAPFYELDNTVRRAQRGGSQRVSTPEELRAEPPTTQIEGSNSITVPVGTAVKLAVTVKDDGYPGPAKNYRGRDVEGGGASEPAAVPLLMKKSAPAQDMVSAMSAAKTGLAVTFLHYRGPGAVKFDPMTVPLDKNGGQAATSAYFSEPGTYIIRAVANDQIFTTPADFTVTVTAGHVERSARRVASLAPSAAALPPEPIAAAEPAITFSKDVAPIMQRSCQTCHRPGTMAPMSLMTYEQVRPYARAVKAKVSSRQMPPWGVDRTIGHQGFKNDNSLNDREIATIVKWVDAGAPQGNPDDMPPPRTFNDDSAWSLPGGTPDFVVTAPPYTTKANAHESWADLMADVPLTEDRWVSAYQSKPSKDGVRVVHHMVAYIILPDGTQDGYGLHYVPGKPATIYPDGAGFLLRAGSKVKFDMHYTSVDTEVTDRAQVGFKFYPKGYEPNRKVLRMNWISHGDLDLPAGEDNIRSDGYALMKDNFRLLTYLPHMHIRGKRQCIELIYPATGATETINCFDFNFNWQMVFQYDENSQPLIPKGTILHVINYHDNSVGNRLNPDPKNWAGFGQRTVDDMAITMGEGIQLTDEQFKQALQERAEHTGTHP